MITTTVRIPFLRRFAAAVVSALVLSIACLAAPVILFFGGSQPALFQLAEYFLPSALVMFVILAIFALVGLYHARYVALVGGFVASAIGALVGSAINVTNTGAPVPEDFGAQLFGTLLGLNLPFVIAGTILAMTAGSAIWGYFLRSADIPPRRIALVRAPADTLADGQVTHIEASVVDVELANSQWDEYVATLANAGFEIQEVPPAELNADSVFVEDTMVIFGDLAVIGSPGSEQRVAEIVDAEKTARDLGLTITHIDLPGTLDGGDVLKVDQTVYVGRGGRTNAEGIRQLRAIVAPLGYTVVAVPVTKALHLKSAVTALPDGTVIGFLPLVDDPTIFGRFLAVPEAEGVAVVVLSPDTVLMSRAAPLSIALIEDLGYRVLTADISEFEKIEGCVTCLSVRVR